MIVCLVSYLVLIQSFGVSLIAREHKLIKENTFQIISIIIWFLMLPVSMLQDWLVVGSIWPVIMMRWRRIAG